VERFAVFTIPQFPVSPSPLPLPLNLFTAFKSRHPRTYEAGVQGLWFSAFHPVIPDLIRDPVSLVLEYFKIKSLDSGLLHAGMTSFLDTSFILFTLNPVTPARMKRGSRGFLCPLFHIQKTKVTGFRSLFITYRDKLTPCRNDRQRQCWSSDL